MLNKELEDFYRRIKLKAHFKNPENKAHFTEEDIFRKPTNKTWVSNNNHHSVETFIEATRNEINNEIEKTKRSDYSNLSVKEQKAFQELHTTENHKRLNHNPTTSNNETVNKIIKRFHKENLISKNIAEGLKIESPKSPDFYLKQKLHKGVVPEDPL